MWFGHCLVRPTLVRRGTSKRRQVGCQIWFYLALLNTFDATQQYWFRCCFLMLDMVHSFLGLYKHIKWENFIRKFWSGKPGTRGQMTPREGQGQGSPKKAFVSPKNTPSSPKKSPTSPKIVRKSKSVVAMSDNTTRWAEKKIK